jgi:hypothetical protein
MFLWEGGSVGGFVGQGLLALLQMPDVRHIFWRIMKSCFENNCSYFKHVNEAKGSAKHLWRSSIIEVRKASQGIQHRRCCENGEFY